MTDTSNKDETVVPSKNDGTPEVTPTVVKTEDSAVEELRKQLEQQQMRANQLANQLKAKEDADAAAKEKELEEQNQYKELFEQERIKREALETEQQTKEREAELKAARDNVLSGFSEEVKQLAEEVGMDLLDTDEASVARFTEKLTKISERVTGQAKVTPNNPNQREVKMDLTTEQLREGLQSKEGFDEIVAKKYPGIAAMMSPKRS